MISCMVVIGLLKRRCGMESVKATQRVLFELLFLAVFCYYALTCPEMVRLSEEPSF